MVLVAPTYISSLKLTTYPCNHIHCMHKDNLTTRFLSQNLGKFNKNKFKHLVLEKFRYMVTTKTVHFNYTYSLELY